MRQRTQVRTPQERDRLLRLAAAYQEVFIINGETGPAATRVLNDLARACMFAAQELPSNTDQAMVRASLNAVYSRILRLCSLRPDDVILTTREKDDA
jgi:hypothetical protein